VQTVYSNLVGLRANPNELVLEFSFFLAERPGQGPPANLEPEVRVVLLSGALDGLLGALTQAKAIRDKAVPQVQKTPPGFRPGGAP
jgi:hypothetical protein